MIIDRLDRTEIARNWHWIAQLLAPAVRLDPRRRLEEVHRGLETGTLGLATVHGEGSCGLVVVEPGIFDGVFCCWLPYIAGKCALGPRAWVKMMRQIIKAFEDSARAAGCAEVRIGGRDWSKILPDYEPFDGVRNGMKKVLI